MSGSVFFRPLLFYHTVFIQFVTLGFCLPALILFTTRAVDDTRNDRKFATLMGFATIALLALTGTYLALLTFSMLSLWLVWAGLRRRITPGVCCGGA